MRLGKADQADLEREQRGFPQEEWRLPALDLDDIQIGAGALVALVAAFLLSRAVFFGLVMIMGLLYAVAAIIRSNASGRP